MEMKQRDGSCFLSIYSLFFVSCGDFFSGRLDFGLGRLFLVEFSNAASLSRTFVFSFFFLDPWDWSCRNPHGSLETPSTYITVEPCIPYS